MHDERPLAEIRRVDAYVNAELRVQREGRAVAGGLVVNSRGPWVTVASEVMTTL